MSSCYHKARFTHVYVTFSANSGVSGRVSCSRIISLSTSSTALLVSTQWVQESSHALTGALSECYQGQPDIPQAQCRTDLGGPVRDLLEMQSLQQPGPGTWVRVLLGPHPRALYWERAPLPLAPHWRMHADNACKPACIQFTVIAAR